MSVLMVVVASMFMRTRHRVFGDGYHVRDLPCGTVDLDTDGTVNLPRQSHVRQYRLTGPATGGGLSPQPLVRQAQDSHSERVGNSLCR